MPGKTRLFFRDFTREVSREQEYIGRLYERVDALRGGASARLARALRQDGGTAQARLDRSSGDSQPDLADVRRDLRADAGGRARLDDLWPLLTPRRLLSELFADPARLLGAAPDLPAAERTALVREPGGRTAADVPLLDEAAELLGQDERVAQARSPGPAAHRTTAG